jgi:hypothetical protein
METRLQACVAELQRLAAGGAAFSAVAMLGEVLAIAGDEEYDAAGAAVRGHADVALVEAAVAEATAVRRRASHILSIGTSFTWDELVLVLTMRMQLELAFRVFDLFGIDTGAFDPATLDAELREVAQSKENARRFASALATMRRN